MVIQQVLQIGNNFNDWDDNVNTEQFHQYTNPNPVNYNGAFYGGIVRFPTCVYIFNMARNQDHPTVHSFYFQRMTISILYDATLVRKNTIFHQDYQNSFEFSTN